MLTIAKKYSMEEFSDLSIILSVLDMILNHVAQFMKKWKL